jgi:hypothetical protein
MRKRVMMRKMEMMTKMGMMMRHWTTFEFELSLATVAIL